MNAVACSRYAGRMRRLAIAVKDGRRDALVEAAMMMAPLIAERSTVVPMPSHEGMATYMLGLAIEIAKTRPDVRVEDVLKSAPHPSMYSVKKGGGRARPVKMWMASDVRADGGIVVIDNVISSGATALSAASAMPGASFLFLADATRSGKAKSLLNQKERNER